MSDVTRILSQIESDAEELAMVDPHEEVLAIDDALNKLAEEDPQAAQLAMLRQFFGNTPA